MEEKKEDVQKFDLDKAKMHIMERLDYFSLMNDYFFSAFMKDNLSCMQVALRAFTGDDTIEVMHVETQRSIENFRPGFAQNPEGRGIRLDSCVKAQDGRVFVLEVENRGENLELRLRYYASLTDTFLLHRGDKFSSLVNLTTIVVMPKDVRGLNRPTYCIRRCFVESASKVGNHAEIFDDGSMFLLVNGRYRDRDSLLGRVIHDFVTPLSEPKLVKEFRDEMEQITKDSEKRKRTVESMVNESLANIDLENLLTDAEKERVHKEGREEGREEGHEEIFKSMILDVLPSGSKKNIKIVMGQISRIGRLPMEKIQNIVQLVAKENNLKIPDGLFDDAAATTQSQK